MAHSTERDRNTDAAATQNASDAWLDRSLCLFLLINVLITFVAAIVQISLGSYKMSLSVVLECLFNREVVLNPDVWLDILMGNAASLSALDRETLIVWNIRVPRLLAAVVVGACLSVSGALLQAITRNELASPYVLGISSGSGLAILLALVVFPAATYMLPLWAAAGGFITFFLVYLIAWKGGADPVRLVLGGVIVGAVFGSLQTALFLFADNLQIMKSAIEWTTGSLVGRDWDDVRMLLPWAVPTLILSMLGSRQLNLLLLGENTARSLGLHVERTRFLLCLLAVIAAAGSVTVAGIIGFVGLIIPHIVRSCVGTDYRRVLIGCMVAGPSLLVVADTTARLLFNPMQVPVGIITGVLGGMYFLYLMRRQKEIGAL